MSKHIGTLIDVSIEKGKAWETRKSKAVITLKEEHKGILLSFDNMVVTIPEEKMRMLLNQSENPTS